MKWHTDFFEWYGGYTKLIFTIEEKEKALQKIQYLLNEGVDLKIEFYNNEIWVFMYKEYLKKYRRFLFDIETTN